MDKAFFIFMVAVVLLALVIFEWVTGATEHWREEKPYDK